MARSVWTVVAVFEGHETVSHGPVQTQHQLKHTHLQHRIKVLHSRS